MNLAGILTPGEKVPRLAGNRLLFENGVPIAVQSGGDVHYLTPLDAGAMGGEEPADPQAAPGQLP